MFILANVGEEERIILGSYRMINLKNVKMKYREPLLCNFRYATISVTTF